MGAAASDLAIVDDILNGGVTVCNSEGESYNNALSLLAKNADSELKQYRADIEHRRQMETDAIASQEYGTEMVLFTSTDKSPDEIRQDLQDCYMEYRMQTYANGLNDLGSDLNMAGMQAGLGTTAMGYGVASLAFPEVPGEQFGLEAIIAGAGAAADSLWDFKNMVQEHGKEKLYKAVRYTFGDGEDAEPMDDFMADWAVIDTYTEIEQADSIDRNIEGITQFPGEDLDKETLEDLSTLNQEEMPDGCTAYRIDMTMTVEEPVNA